jgi:hypothetical protein
LVNVSAFSMDGTPVDQFMIEAPVATQLEGGQLALS